jgi:hypothetical protein
MKTKTITLLLLCLCFIGQSQDRSFLENSVPDLADIFIENITGSYTVQVASYTKNQNEVFSTAIYAGDYTSFNIISMVWKQNVIDKFSDIEVMDQWFISESGGHTLFFYVTDYPECILCVAFFEETKILYIGGALNK